MEKPKNGKKQYSLIYPKQTKQNKINNNWENKQIDIKMDKPKMEIKAFVDIFN